MTVGSFAVRIGCIPMPLKSTQQEFLAAAPAGDNKFLS